jgi:siderophore synthetase component
MVVRYRYAILNAMVVRTVNKKELNETPDAQQAMDHGYNKLKWAMRR